MQLEDVDSIPLIERRFVQQLSHRSVERVEEIFSRMVRLGDAGIAAVIHILDDNMSFFGADAAKALSRINTPDAAAAVIRWNRRQD
jgi:hypothetical protein